MPPPPPPTQNRGNKGNRGIMWGRGGTARQGVVGRSESEATMDPEARLNSSFSDSDDRLVVRGLWAELGLTELHLPGTRGYVC